MAGGGRKKKDAPRSGNGATLGFEEKLWLPAVQAAVAPTDFG